MNSKFPFSQIELELFVENALKEDVGDGDHTSLACIDATGSGKANLIMKEDGIIAGIDVGRFVYKKIDEELQIEVFNQDGAEVRNNDIVLKIEGSPQSILKGERLVLNIMQRMSGIATTTNQVVKKVERFNTKILDTRKTTPGMRMLEKWAVSIGGGENHRFGLYDVIMIKDNHIDFAGGIQQAIEKAKSYIHESNKQFKVIIEARDLDHVKEILDIGGIDRILLDNFSIEDLTNAVSLINNQYQTEASGGISVENVRYYAETGVDYISIGALTHSVKSLDMSLLVEK